MWDILSGICFLFVLILLVLIQSGCSEPEIVMLTEGASDEADATQEMGSSANATIESVASGEGQTPMIESQGQEHTGASSGNAADAEVGLQADVVSQETEYYYIHLCGAVAQPGVYRVKAGTRLYEVLELAGGFAENACQTLVNLAGSVADGSMVYIPSMEEVESGSYVQNNPVESGGGTYGSAAAGQESDGLININTADALELCKLPGIGTTRAEAIIAYRDTNGQFQAIEDLMKVNGIKQGVYDSLKALIKVR